MLEKSKKKILSLKIIICIIINLLKLKQVYSNKPNKLIDKLSVIKDFSKIAYNAMSMNIVSVIINTIPLCMNIKKTFKK